MFAVRIAEEQSSSDQPPTTDGTANLTSDLAVGSDKKATITKAHILDPLRINKGDGKPNNLIALPMFRVMCG